MVMMLVADVHRPSLAGIPNPVGNFTKPVEMPGFLWNLSEKKWVFPPNHPLKNRVFHYFHHAIFGSRTIFGNTHMEFFESNKFNGKCRGKATRFFFCA